ncbi:hypothetical protein EBZ38_13350 [bacterium]|nr:hypothetical protein [bacterium]NDC95634.1 hypothetical protein [bacterium]NDD85243.1 hypothetical protein [bacterium]
MKLLDKIKTRKKHMAKEDTTPVVDEAVTEVAEVVVEDVFRKEGETQQEYNERVPVAVQPVLEGPTTSYLGQPL